MTDKELRGLEKMDFLYVKGEVQRFYSRAGDWVTHSGGTAHKNSCELPAPLVCDQTLPDGSVRQVKLMVPSSAVRELDPRIMITEEPGHLVMTHGDKRQETTDLMKDIQTFVKELA